MFGHLNPKWVIIIITAIICCLMVLFAFYLPEISIPEDR